VEIIERRALAHVTAMKENLAIITQADEPMALTNQDLGNSTSRGPAARISPRRLAPNVSAHPYVLRRTNIQRSCVATE
jgi:hypothetical protein